MNTIAKTNTLLKTIVDLYEEIGKPIQEINYSFNDDECIIRTKPYHSTVEVQIYCGDGNWRCLASSDNEMNILLFYRNYNFFKISHNPKIINSLLEKLCASLNAHIENEHVTKNEFIAAFVC